MFRKKLSQIEIFPKFLCSCCYSDSNHSRKNSDDIKGPRGRADGKDASDEKKGAAYAYEDETSSDSDDEVLKRFKTSMETAATMKRSASRHSQRGSPGGVIRSPSSLSQKSSKASTVKEGLKKEDSIVVTDEVQKSSESLTKDGAPREEDPEPLIKLTESPKKDGSPSTGQESPPKEGQASGTTSPLTVSLAGSIQTPEGVVTYENQAYDGISQSGSELMADRNQGQKYRAMQGKEHLFDVSDLQQEPPLISKCGSLEVTFSYEAKRKRMHITIHQAQEIPAKERGGANNTQVRLLLLPTKKQRFKTKVKPGENPTFEETCVFNKLSPEEVTGMGVRFRLYGTERMRRERMIGESIIGFSCLNLEEPTTHWVILEPRSNLSQGESHGDVSSLSRSDSASSTQSLQHGGMPELLLGLSYNGTTGRLSVEVIKGSNFRNMAMNRAPDTYVKLTLMAPNGSEVTHSKTSVRRGQPNPLFKETFMFQVALFQLADVTLMVSVYNKKSMKKKEMIGWFSLGLNSSGEEEGSHWSDMRESKGETVCRWHVLLES